jgi:arginase
MAEALRAAGIVDRLGAIDAGDVAPSAYDPTWEPGTGTRNVAAIADHAVALADGLDTIFAKGSFPVVLGGDCSILLGSMLAGGRLGADLLRSGAGPGWLARPPAGAGHRDRLFDTPA